jgi:hypothetical protein
MKNTINRSTFPYHLLFACGVIICIMMLMALCNPVYCQDAMGNSLHRVHADFGNPNMEFSRQDTMLRIYDLPRGRTMGEASYITQSADTIIEGYHYGSYWMYFVDGLLVKQVLNVPRREYRRLKRLLEAYPELDGWHRAPKAWCRCTEEQGLYFFICTADVKTPSFISAEP